MRRRFPLHRSLVLWGGALAMSFIVWAWRDSCSHTAVVGNTKCLVGNFQSGIVVLRGNRVRARWEADRREESNIFADLTPLPCLVRVEDPFAQELEIAPPQDDPEKPQTIEAPQSVKGFLTGSLWFLGPESWALFIPHWLILLGTAGMTGGLLAWQLRRWRSWQRQQQEAQAAGSTMEGVG